MYIIAYSIDKQAIATAFVNRRNVNRKSEGQNWAIWPIQLSINGRRKYAELREYAIYITL